MLKTVKAIALTSLIATAFAENEKSNQKWFNKEKNEINFGVINAQNGSASALGKGITLGLEAALNDAEIPVDNKKYKIKLIIKNDGYDVKTAKKNIVSLLEKDNILAVIGGVGTPTGNIIIPHVVDKKIPIFGWFSGAYSFYETSRGKKDDSEDEGPYFFNYRATYNEETQAIIDFLPDVDRSEIALLIQDDDFGTAGLLGITKALEKIDKKPLLIGKFKPNSIEIEEGLKTILSKKSKAIFIIAPYKPLAVAIKKIRAKKDYKDIKILALSSVGSEALVAEMKKLKINKKDQENIIVTQVTVDPTNDKIPFVKEYNDALKKICATDSWKKEDVCKYNNPVSYISLEGYIIGRTTIEALKSMKEQTRQGFKDSLQKLSTDLGGIKIKFSDIEDSRFRNVKASSRVILTQLKDGRFSPIN